MKRSIYLLSLVLLLGFTPNEKEKFIDKGIFKVWYSEEYRSPIKVVYSAYHYKDNPTVTRKGLSFYSEQGIRTASNVDFKGNKYDKGHMCPAETFSHSKEAIKKTFSYLNCTVQYYELNRGLWAKLENMERKWSQKDSLIVTANVYFDEHVKKLPTGTAIPKSFGKSIHFFHSKKTTTYLFPNEDCKKPIDTHIVKMLNNNKR